MENPSAIGNDWATNEGQNFIENAKIPWYECRLPILLRRFGRSFPCPRVCAPTPPSSGLRTASTTSKFTSGGSNRRPASRSRAAWQPRTRVATCRPRRLCPPLRPSSHHNPPALARAPHDSGSLLTSSYPVWAGLTTGKCQVRRSSKTSSDPTSSKCNGQRQPTAGAPRTKMPLCARGRPPAAVRPCRHDVPPLRRPSLVPAFSDVASAIPDKPFILEEFGARTPPPPSHGLPPGPRHSTARWGFVHERGPARLLVRCCTMIPRIRCPAPLRRRAVAPRRGRIGPRAMRAGSGGTR